MGYPYPRFQHCFGVLRWIQECNRPREPPPGASATLSFQVISSYLFGLQRDYFGAHTFRVLPGKENAKFKTGEDIRKSSL